MLNFEGDSAVVESFPHQGKEVNERWNWEEERLWGRKVRARCYQIIYAPAQRVGAQLLSPHDAVR